MLKQKNSVQAGHATCLHSSIPTIVNGSTRVSRRVARLGELALIDPGCHVSVYLMTDHKRIELVRWVAASLGLNKCSQRYRSNSIRNSSFTRSLGCCLLRSLLFQKRLKNMWFFHRFYSHVFRTSSKYFFHWIVHFAQRFKIPFIDDTHFFTRNSSIRNLYVNV